MKKTENSLKVGFDRVYSKSKKFICQLCERIHSGVYSEKICHYCWEKGHR